MVIGEAEARLQLSNPRQGARYVLAINKSGANLTAGSVVVLDPTAANNRVGGPLAVTTTTTAGNELVCGAVADDASTIPANAEFYVQVSGYHGALRLDGTTDVANGDTVGTHTAAGVAAKVTDKRKALAILLGAAHTDNGESTRAVLLIDPLGLGR